MAASERIANVFVYLVKKLDLSYYSVKHSK